MLHAAAMLCALAVIWLALTQQWTSPQHWAVALGVSALCVVLALRFGGASRVFARAPQSLALLARRWGVVARGVQMTLRAAISADVTLKPALVRVKARVTRSTDLAAMAAMISLAPGAVVVDVDSEGMLVHVINEDAVDADDLGRVEQRIGGGAR